MDERQRPLLPTLGRRAERRPQASADSGDTGLEIAVEFYDATVSGADPLDVQKGLTTLLTSYVESGVGAILVENASCFVHGLIHREPFFLNRLNRKHGGSGPVEDCEPPHIAAPSSVLLPYLGTVRRRGVWGRNQQDPQTGPKNQGCSQTTCRPWAKPIS